jgi:uncharacterized membrane protein YozB (DUF420 family)
VVATVTRRLSPLSPLSFAEVFSLSGPTIILTLKVLVSVVTLLFAVAVWAIATGRKRLHGRVNTVFFALTLTTVVGFEVLLRVQGNVKDHFTPEQKQALLVHLCFAVPSAVLLLVMMTTALLRWKRLHVACGLLFALLWLGTFVTGVFFLPHDG